MSARTYVAAALILGTSPVLGGSAFVSLFESSAKRSETGLQRQLARRSRAFQELARAKKLIAAEAISQSEYDLIETIAILSDLDLEIAELRAKQSTISLELAKSLDRNGQRVPLCKRKRESDEDSISELIAKKPKSVINPLPEQPTEQSGTRVYIPEPEEAPSPEPDTEPNQTGGATAGGGDTGEQPGGDVGGEPGGNPGSDSDGDHGEVPGGAGSSEVGGNIGGG